MTERIIIDVASYQGAQPDISGAAGMMIKAVEGEWPNTNPLMDAQVEWAISHGLPFGFYDFWHPQFGGTADMQIFIQKIYGYHPKLGAVIDAEVSDGLDGGTILHNLLEDLRYVFSFFPFRTWLYSADWWLTPNTYGPQKEELAQLAALWIAGYTPNLPRIPYPFKNAIMWQFTDSWHGNIHGQDASRFIGTDEQWNFLTDQVHVLPASYTVKIKGVQKAVHAVEDGIFGTDTHNRVFRIRDMRDPAHRNDPKAVKAVQKMLKIPETGKYDKKTHDTVGVCIQNMQRAMGASPVDGTWNDHTAFAEAVLDPFV